MRFGKERVALVADVRPGVTGAFRGRAPPKRLLVPPQTKVVPPKRELCPE